MKLPTLDILFGELHNLIEAKLRAVRALPHPTSMGDGSEEAWRELLADYLPQRYSVTSAHAVDHEGNFSQQLDIVIFDRQYSPLIFQHQGQTVIPAESIYAVFEAKQVVTASLLRYASDKLESVRKLKRTSLPIPTANGEAKPQELKPIIGGFLALRSEWNPPLGKSLLTNLTSEKDPNRQLDIGCIAEHGIFKITEAGSYSAEAKSKPATVFLLELISRLQSRATVPMIDLRAYEPWLEAEAE